MVHVEYWETEEDIRTFDKEKEAVEWIQKNCTNESGRPLKWGEAAYYNGARISMY